MATWPGEAEVAVSLTFDVDAESGWLQADVHAFLHEQTEEVT